MQVDVVELRWNLMIKLLSLKLHVSMITS